MTTNIEQKDFSKAIQIGSKVLRKTLKFTLNLLVIGLEGINKKEEYEPTLEEIMRGEKLPFSDEYFIPSRKSHK